MLNGSTFVSSHCWTNNVRQFDPSHTDICNISLDSERQSLKSVGNTLSPGTPSRREIIILFTKHPMGEYSSVFLCQHETLEI